MNKDLWGDIKKAAKFYDIDIKDVDKENAGAFIEVDGKKVKINDLPENDILDKVFCFDYDNLNYSLFIVDDKNINKNILDINTYCTHLSFYNGKKNIGKVA